MKVAKNVTNVLAMGWKIFRIPSQLIRLIHNHNHVHNSQLNLVRVRVRVTVPRQLDEFLNDILELATL